MHIWPYLHPDHPSRDEQDTFYLENGDLLRCLTSPVQIRYMMKHKPPHFSTGVYNTPPASL